MTKHTVCTIDGCGKRHEARGYCNKHYLAWRHRGDPLGCRHRAEEGELLNWMVEVTLPYKGEECLIWPFGKGKDGCGLVTVNGRRIRAPRISCEYRNGPPPHRNSVARHSCGNGDQGCVNPNHLIWGSQYENTQDTVAHGKTTRGNRNPMAKLTTEAVLSIRKMAKLKRHSEVAEEYGITRGTVSALSRGASWSWLKDEE